MQEQRCIARAALDIGDLAERDIDETPRRAKRRRVGRLRGARACAAGRRGHGRQRHTRADGTGGERGAGQFQELSTFHFEFRATRVFACEHASLLTAGARTPSRRRIQMDDFFRAAGFKR
jgi:hypothetical protein